MEIGKKITIYLTTGLPKGMREVRIDQWSGKAICGPRTALKELISHPDIEKGASLYFLTGPAEDGGLLNVYVGEADGFKERIKHHDSKKDWWQEVAIFVSQDGSLTKTGVQYLESVCYQRLKKIGKCSLLNSNTPAPPSIPKEDLSGLEMFYENVSTIMPLLGYDIFLSEGAPDSEHDFPVLVCKRGVEVTAKGQLTAEGKIKVLKGSKAEKKETDSFQTHPYKKLRDELIKMGRLQLDGKTLVFTDDYLFDSSSAAAAVIQARSARGPIEWKTEQGLTLKDLLERKIA